MTGTLLPHVMTGLLFVVLPALRGRHESGEVDDCESLGGQDGFDVLG